MKNTLAAVFGAAAALAAASAVAAPLDDITARLDALEKENAAIRKENAALRENKRLLEDNTKLQLRHAGMTANPAAESVDATARSSRRARARGEVAASLPESAFSKRGQNPLEAYAADIPLKASPPAAPGQFRTWIEGGAIWSGGDPVVQTYGITGLFDLTPKVGWEAAIGFDYGFAGSPWHVSGQFRYGEGGKTSGFDATSQTLTLGAASQTETHSFEDTYNETRWLADLAIGRDIAGSGPAALQLKGGFRVAEFSTRSTTSDGLANVTRGLTPPFAVPGFPPVSDFSITSTTSSDTRASFLGAGPLIGIEGSVPFGGRWSLDYVGDAALLIGRQRSFNTAASLFSTTPSYLATALGLPSSVATSNDRLFAGVLSADIQVGISYWMTENLKIGASYRLDALVNVFNESGSAGAGLTPDRYTHGPRVTLTGRFDAI